MIHHCLAYVRLDYASSINLYRAGFDTGLAEGTAAVTEVEIGQAGHFMLRWVQMNDGWFAGGNAGLLAVSAVLIQLQVPMPWRRRPQRLLTCFFLSAAFPV
jgi:hypothetical protein